MFPQLEKAMAPYSSTLAWRIPWKEEPGAWWAAVHGVAKSQTRLSDFTFTFHFYPLEKEMATHSSVLAWRIPGTGEPGGLPSMGSHRVGHDWSDLATAAAACSHNTLGIPVGSVVKNLPALQETWVRSLDREDPLEKEMEAHSCILAWRTPWTEEPGGLQSIRSWKGQTRLNGSMHTAGVSTFVRPAMVLGTQSEGVFRDNNLWKALRPAAEREQRMAQWSGWPHLQFSAPFGNTSSLLGGSFLPFKG